MAVRGNRIVFVGDADAAAEWRGPATQVIDAGGRTLLPGFIDSHYHLYSGSLSLRHMQLYETDDPATLRANIAAFAAANVEKEWLEGRGLKYNAVPPGGLTRQFLDDIVGARPLFIVAFDGHTAWANTEALRRAGLLQGRAVGPNSESRPRPRHRSGYGRVAGTARLRSRACF